MDSMIELSLEMSAWLQASFSQIDGFWQFISNLGSEDFYLAFFPFIYWCLNKRIGKELTFLLLFSNGLNEILKHGFRGPRPFWLEPALARSEEPTYGVPSGHMHYTTTIYLYLAAEIRRRWAWIFAFLLIILMGISRVYLGVHFFHDVLAGFIVALLVLGGFWLGRRRWGRAFVRRILGQRLLIILLVPLLLALLYLLVRLLIGAPDSTVVWATYIPTAELAGLENVTTAVAALVGFGIGIMMEGSRTRFKVDGPWWQRLLRYVVGLVVTLVIYLGISMITPEEPLIISLVLRFIRYSLLTLWVTWYGPAFFVWVRLAGSDPEPELNISLREQQPS